ncbi:DUF4190 domain-containing protein [Leucobacter sp. OH2974_COT-288]|uniref:DUF4190 domain-containing protein n=1 Tax=Canibacter oris TaxID=1365628 RepID=A0A840DP09_9MICO|nr:DUF4190 domain-containing protein [Canibacter oris]MBB4071768.1 hypothetical protein [Canibacter oris]RRD35124.1 DUF4190 domain-containing protein [Leucobacter sp. OH2974_COT-288]
METPNTFPQGEQPQAQQPGYLPPQQAPLPQNEKTNVMAIVGFVLSFFVSLVGAILSLVALSQIKKTGEKGRGLAIAGAIIGFVGTILTIIYVIFALVITAAGVNAALSSSNSDTSITSSDTSSTTDSSDSSVSLPGNSSDPYCIAMKDFIEYAASMDTSDAAASIAGFTGKLQSVSALTDNTSLKSQIDDTLKVLNSGSINDISTIDESKLFDTMQLIGADYTEKCLDF